MPGTDSTRAPQPHGRVRWRRFAVAAVPALAFAAVVTGATTTGAIASSISVSGKEYLITSRQLDGHGFVQYGGTVDSDQGGGQHATKPVMVSGIRHATLSHLCQSVDVGPVTLRLTAGSGSTPVSADNLTVDSSGQSGTLAVFHNVSIGQDASTLNKDGASSGAASAFGEQADSVTIDNLRQDTWLTTAGTFTLPGLSLGFGHGC
jgi:hypothetical protein